MTNSKVSPTKETLPFGLKITIVTLGILASLIGISVMVGWFIHFPLIIRGNPSSNTMKFNTALSFFIAGLGMIFAFYRQRNIPKFSGGLLLFISSSVLAEYLMGINLRVDEFFIGDYLTNPATFPGRMEPQAALCFFTFALSLMIDGLSIKRDVAMFCQTMAGAFLLFIGGAAIFGYILHIPFAFTWGSYNALAINTAIGFVFLGLGSMLVGFRNFYLLLIVTAMLGITLAVQAYYGVSNAENEQFKQMVPGLLLIVILVFTFLMVYYLYTQVRKRVLIEKIVEERMEEIREVNEKLKAEIIVREVAEKRLMKALRAKSEFTSMVSHELRTPLTVIKETIAIVHEEVIGPINPKQKDFLETAKRNIDRLGRLINEVLDHQKIEAGGVEFNMNMNDINETIRDVAKSFQLAINNKGLSLDLQLQEGLPKIPFDKDKIIQVMSNLLSNAMKFTEKGTITIISQKEGENGIKVSVIDQGIGIKEKDLDKLFKSFSQISTGVGRQTGGTGLGLALSKSIIEKHRGKIEVISVFDQGSIFYFILPIEERRK